MSNQEALQEQIQKLMKERDAYAEALATSNAAFVDKVKEFSIIKRISDSISWSHDKQRICTEIVDLIIDETTAENCSLWLIDPDERFLVLVAARGQENSKPKYFPPASARQRKMKVGEGAAGWVAEHGTSLLIEDVSKSSIFVHIESKVSRRIQSLLCLPIKGRGNTLGVLNLSHPDIGAFSEENERVLQLITDQAGIVITNYFLFEEIESFNRKLEYKVEVRARNLRMSEERYARAVAAGKVGIWDWKVGSWWLYVAPNLKAMLGFSDHEISNNLKDWLKLIHPEDRKGLLRRLSTQLRGQSPVYEGEHRMFHKNGQIIWFFVRGAAVFNEKGQILRLSGSNTDITQRKEAELELQKAQEASLAQAHAVGRAEFATGVLHNIANVLNSVNVTGNTIQEFVSRSRLPQLARAFAMLTDHSENLLDFLTKDAKGTKLPEYLTRVGGVIDKDFREMQRLVREINDKIHLMRDVIETQQTHAKNNQRVAEEDLSKLVEDALKIQMESLNKHDIRIHRRFKPVPRIRLAIASFLHVLINLLKNAIEAMENSPPSEKNLYLELAVEDGWIVLKVADSGEGINKENMKSLFQHGFTTKKYGHGFGLHFCRGSIEDMGGTIHAYSDGPGHGATFVISLPAPTVQPDEALDGTGAASVIG
ncbi:PAS domain-containing protein [Sulfidibacter corallicola]|uniref:histidine kinase n=1 Tax=Sulfidibacter corallicola TaxID=2818388 RepID=A0A8A4TV30_SULCO|nr:ATP-binding protein [Sulfidibacter corallicola]QTD53217.1 PAS domain-containing protein [Sulfidibacter corallicola]